MVSASVTIGPKGQILIPKLLRDGHGLRPGSKAILLEEGNKLVIQTPADDMLKAFDEISKAAPQSNMDPHYYHDESLNKRFKRALLP